jgi:NAD(P)-dependent dehydrogenase (short-subunit alcohol dehydrogenase family)
MSLRDKTCIVVGATGGIGRAIVLSMAAGGARLGLVGRDLSRLEEVAAQARSYSVRVESYRADLVSDEDVQQFARDVTRDFAFLDILVHSAGIFRMGPLSEAPISDLDLLYRTNVRGPYALTQALLPMLVARQGQIVFINSSVGLRARAGVGPYAASKHALKALADSLRAEVNARGVRVISVYPGRTATPQQEKIYEQEGRSYRPDLLLQPEDVARSVLDALAMPCTAEVTDINIRPMQKS